MSTDRDPAPTWLIRVPEIFRALTPDLLARLAAESSKPLGQDYTLLRTPKAEAITQAEWAPLVRWNLPIEHSWPCRPAKMEGFVEKAAQALRKRFGDRRPQGLFIAALHSTSPDPYYKNLAANLRGRALQVFPEFAVREPELQDPQAESLFCLVGKEGLFAGMQSPRACNGFYPGGSKFIAKNHPESISRAGAKIAEAWHYLQLYRPPLVAGSHWLELGACPGGMTSELLARDQLVTAIDRAPLDKRLDGREGLTFVHADVAEFEPPRDQRYDALLCDMNGPPEEAIAEVIRLSASLKKSAPVVFTLKLTRVESIDAACAQVRALVSVANESGLRRFAQTHLTYNRHEFTLFLERADNR